MDRVGVYTTGERRAVFERVVGGMRRVDARVAGECSLAEALEAWTAAGVPVAVIDDCALAEPEDETFLIEWAGKATAAAPRVVMVFDGTRGVEDDFLYQLVSTADVKDLVVTSVGDTLTETLPARIERPARLMDVAHWKTADKRKLKRRGRRRGKQRRGFRLALGGERRGSGLGMRAKAGPSLRVGSDAGSGLREGPDASLGRGIGPTSRVGGGDTAHELLREGSDASLDRGAGRGAHVGGGLLREGRPGWGSDDGESVAQVRFLGRCGADSQDNDGNHETDRRLRMDEIESGVEEAAAEEEVAGQAGEALEREGATPEVGGDPETEPGEPKRVSAASLMANTGMFGEVMRREGGSGELTCPSAHSIVAVGAASRGIGCTYLACALAIELVGKGVETCVAVSDPATFEAMRRSLSPDSLRSDEFSFAGATFYAWKSQRAHAGEFDCVVCDCGMVDYPDDDPDSPASLFRRSGYRAMLVSGAPWLLDESSAAISVRDRNALASTTWFTISAGSMVATNIAMAIAQASGKSRVEVHPVPYRPDLLCGDASCYGDYAAILDGVVAAAKSRKLDPVEFARRNDRRRG